MTIQWFPGHMAKARREVQEKLKLVDFVIELVDARAPLASQNPMLHQVLQQKPKMRVLMKKDLADPQKTSEWIKANETDGIRAVAVDVANRQDIQKVIEVAKSMAEEKMARLARKGVRPRAARAMIIGIPNVGKSTLINRLANRKIAKTGDRPGITTAQQWIKVKKDFELLDTPGILWPKFEDQVVGYRLAAIGTIKDQLLPLEEIAVFVLDYLKENYPELLIQRYQLESTMDRLEIIDHIGTLRGCLASGGTVDLEKTADVIIRDLRSGKIGRVTLEKPKN
ncbi:ribosome biogenesis GTPase A [Natronobacillus azotifigens]|uniref:Ribosome biogenesis GTPase A n=1 Tax=Natronobacillus azotifigens TaxID=472978 RepID=A0A9J6RDZ0_9BACI|nr:ribosome biogenesis GTPase YlqF [Natronobacillus azotifigens]MCZ0703409.1 ribosome biogenesis GTPase YlqF [Natronobacillus azotifigens]